MLSAKFHTRSPGFGCAMSTTARRTVDDAAVDNPAAVASVTLPCVMSPDFFRSAAAITARGPGTDPDDTSREALDDVMAQFNPSSSKTRISANPNAMFLIVIDGDTSQSIAGPARSRPPITSVTPPRPPPAFIVSMRPFNCAAPSMVRSTLSPSFAVRRRRSHVVRRSPVIAPETGSLRQNANVHGFPAWSMSSVTTYSSHTSTMSPSVASISSTVCWYGVGSMLMRYTSGSTTSTRPGATFSGSTKVLALWSNVIPERLP